MSVTALLGASIPQNGQSEHATNHTEQILLQEFAQAWLKLALTAPGYFMEELERSVWLSAFRPPLADDDPAAAAALKTLHSYREPEYRTIKPSLSARKLPAPEAELKFQQYANSRNDKFKRRMPSFFEPDFNDAEPWVLDIPPEVDEVPSQEMMELSDEQKLTLAEYNDAYRDEVGESMDDDNKIRLAEELFAPTPIVPEEILPPVRVGKYEGSQGKERFVLELFAYYSRLKQPSLIFMLDAAETPKQPQTRPSNKCEHGVMHGDWYCCWCAPTYLSAREPWEYVEREFGGRRFKRGKSKWVNRTRMNRPSIFRTKITPSTILLADRTWVIDGVRVPRIWKKLNGVAYSQPAQELLDEWNALAARAEANQNTFCSICGSGPLTYLDHDLCPMCASRVLWHEVAEDRIFVDINVDWNANSLRKDRPNRRIVRNLNRRFIAVGLLYQIWNGDIIKKTAVKRYERLVAYHICGRRAPELAAADGMRSESMQRALTRWTREIIDALIDRVLMETGAMRKATLGGLKSEVQLAQRVST